MPGKVLNSSSEAELMSIGAFFSSGFFSAFSAGLAAGAAGAAAFGAWAHAAGSATVAAAKSMAMASAMTLFMGRLLILSGGSVGTSLFPERDYSMWIAAPPREMAQ